MAASEREIQEALRKLAILENDFKHTKEDIERESTETKEELEKTKKELETTKTGLAEVKAELGRFRTFGKNVGFFWLGVIAFGYVVSDGFDKWKEKLFKLFSWIAS